MNKKGFTLLEILIAALILAVVMTGMANLFVAGRRHILGARAKIQAAELGRLFLAPLQMDVTMAERGSGTETGWDQANNCLCIGLSCNPASCPQTHTLDNITYTPAYNISAVSGTTLRKAKVTITWNEPLQP